MKRHGRLWEKLISFENLLVSARKAARGKRFRPATLTFQFHLEKELWRLQAELAGQTYRPGPYRSFFVYEPKKRQISAAPYRDRVVHHALVNVLEPIYPAKTVIFPATQGIRFLGYRVFPTHRWLAQENVKRFRRRIRGLQRQYAAGKLSFGDIYPRIVSWIGHARQANTYRLRCRLFDTISFQRAATV